MTAVGNKKTKADRMRGELIGKKEIDYEKLANISGTSTEKLKKLAEETIFEHLDLFQCSGCGHIYCSSTKTDKGFKAFCEECA